MRHRFISLLSFVGVLALSLSLSGCDKLSSIGSKGDPEAASAADAANAASASAKIELDRKIEDKKAEIERINADLPNLTDEQSKIDAVNNMERLRQELNELVDQRGRM